MTRLPGWYRRRNQTEANSFADRMVSRIGNEHVHSHTTWATGVTHTCKQVVPERVAGGAIRLRLWANDIAAGLRL